MSLIPDDDPREELDIFHPKKRFGKKNLQFAGRRLLTRIYPTSDVVPGQPIIFDITSGQNVINLSKSRICMLSQVRR